MLVPELGKSQKKKIPVDDVPFWQECAICKAIPQVTGEFWKGGELQGELMPPSTQKLEIIGYPYFDDSTASSNRCIKQCPECGTVYRWETE